ncbi:MAG TPA: serine hydrolase [Solimonas sp.]|nr:serine hydrolase [Solimonas sp.]
MSTLKAAPLALAMAAACGAFSAQAATEYSKASPTTDTLIQLRLQAALLAQNVPGISVSVSRHGESIWAGAVGKADVAGNIDLATTMRTRIGSVSKAIVTGPGGYRMLEQSGLEPKQTLVYGPTGLLGTDYDADIADGVRRYSPIVEVDISSNDRTHTWYANGTVSIGATNNLAQYEAPKPFTTPTNWRTIDIRGIAMSKNNTVYTWVDNARNGSTDAPNLYVYQGTPTDLDAITNAGTGNLGDILSNSAPQVTLPSGYTAYDIVGIAIAKSNDHVYVWYDDGMVSEGTSTNFAAYAQPAKFTTAGGSGGLPRDIRGVGIAANDRVYTWFDNGKASIGWSRDLDAYLAPYTYTLPSLTGVPDFVAQYATITAQNLLDHRSGFTRSGDAKGAAVMFNTDEELLSYKQVHQHFLRTRKLSNVPGTRTRYSNHGLGMWTLLVEAHTGIRFADYMEAFHLNPMGVGDKIMPQGDTLDQFDAKGYTALAGIQQFAEIPVAASTTGLAAGGYRATTRALVQVMEWLTRNYSLTCINEMGWDADDGVLSHNGKISGGVALVTIVPTGFKSAANLDVGGLRIAIAVNRETSDLNWLYALRNEIGDLLASVGPKVPPPSPPPPVGSGGFKLACQSK